MRNKTSWYTNTKEDYEKLADIQKCVDELYKKIGGFESEKLACMHMTAEEDYEKLADIQKCVDELYKKIGVFESEKLACMHMTAEYSDWEKANKLFKEIKKIKEELNNGK